MKNSSICWLYTAFGVAQLAVVWGAMQTSQKWPAISPYALSGYSEPANAYISIFVIGVFSALLFWATRKHLFATGRLPTPQPFDGDDPNSSELKLVRRITAVLFLIAPIAAWFHLWNEFLTRGALLLPDKTVVPLAEKALATEYGGIAYLIEKGGTDATRGVEWLALISPMGLVLTVALFSCQMTQAITALIQGRTD